MWRSLKRLEQDITRWRASGWVTEEGASAIRAELEQSRSRIGLANVLGTIGAILIGFAAMSFVAANWQDMSKLARLVMLLAGLWGSYGIAGLLTNKGHSGLADAAVLGGVGIFGASIMLIAQMYHMEGNPPDAVLMWGAGALLAGIALYSAPALVAAMLLAALWAGWETGLREAVYWPFLIGWTAVAAPMVWMRTRIGLHTAAVVLTSWVISLGGFLNNGHAFGLVLVIGLLVTAAAIAAERFELARHELTSGALGYGAVTAYAGLFALQFAERPHLDMMIVFAALSLALILGLLFLAWRNGQRGLLWLAYTGLSIELLGIYFKTIGTLMGSSLFFLTAGLMVMALAWLAVRLHRAPIGKEIAA